MSGFSNFNRGLKTTMRKENFFYCSLGTDEKISCFEEFKTLSDAETFAKSWIDTGKKYNLKHFAVIHDGNGKLISKNNKLQGAF